MNKENKKQMRGPTYRINQGDICAEVGVWRGDYSKQILSRDPKELHLIDPWKHQKALWTRWAKGQAVLDAYKIVCDRFHDNDRVTIHRKDSTDVFLGDNYFDWVYIDADHSSESVWRDLNHWWPQVKVDGFLCGDDYNWKHQETKGPQVAVDKFVKENNLHVNIRHNQYIITRDELQI